MNAFNTRKAANLRRALGIVLFAMFVGLGVSLESRYGIDTMYGLYGIFFIFFGGVALAVWGVVGGKSYEGAPTSAKVSMSPSHAGAAPVEDEALKAV